MFRYFWSSHHQSRRNESKTHQVHKTITFIKLSKCVPIEDYPHFVAWNIILKQEMRYSAHPTDGKEHSIVEII